ncbi:MurR/RpiR family transcriptional regulator [Pseudalkalibacillus salsuginis]|uniref:MurR/RpiR family transcriptional regulator n=1 Tax=Pseudalkalibacillus salsuginis TaxID=2910972 RepID=UPI001F37BF78|nr:MurR/RpiR family transcriptional regulator [Pseudalkalibacillus salsuginis]MCF6411570.1 MurR/RpiR family transcriptional regulator [Pseudalkalibacillus salsuginis]
MTVKQVNQTGNIKGLINSYFPSLTKSEQKVADIVVQQLDQVIYYSVTDLADAAEVGETTVLRFCRKIGLKGYQEFKLAIAKDLANKAGEEPGSPVQNDLFTMISSYTINAIHETVSMNSEEAINKAIDMIDHASSVHFFGVGTSGLTALDAKNRFLRIGRRVDAVIDPHIQSMTAATLSGNDLVIGITVSGSTKDTIDSLKIAKENGAKTIAVTYHARSPITRIADAVLINGGKESPLEGSSLAAKISQLFVIDLLCTGLALKHKDVALEMKEKTAQSVVNKIY